MKINYKLVYSIPIKSITHLNKILKDNKFHNFFICLNFGLLSKKTIKLTKKNTYKIINHIDNTIQNLTLKELKNAKLTNIRIAITKKAFFYEP